MFVSVFLASQEPHGWHRWVPGICHAHSEFTSQPRYAERGESTDFIVSRKQACSLSEGKGDITSSFEIAFYKHKAVKWPWERAFRALHFWCSQQEHTRMLRAHGRSPLPTVSSVKLCSPIFSWFSGDPVLLLCPYVSTLVSSLLVPPFFLFCILFLFMISCFN